MKSNRLLILPSLDIGVAPDGRIRLTGKFISGLTMSAARWGGPVELLAPQDPARESGNLDDVWVRPEELPFQVTVASFDSEEARQAVARSAVVQGGADHRLNHMPAMCRAVGAKYVLLTEYTLRTRWQIIDSEPLNPLVAWRRKAWAWNQERANVAAAKASAAVHCNGTPTYEAYRSLNERTLLYFDSRVEEAMLPDAPRVASNSQPWSESSPIRLAFSGRLNAMKGADHLVLVARALRDLGVPFILDIYGDGVLVPAMQAMISANGLERQVRLGGVLDFGSQLMPTVRGQVDLFVCCHRQGDPSCTYLETMACGVPIVGYANEAFEGLLRHCAAGTSVAMNDVQGLAQAIQRLATDPARLAGMAAAGLAFARQHTFDQTFSRRMQGMAELL